MAVSQEAYNFTLLGAGGKMGKVLGNGREVESEKLLFYAPVELQTSKPASWQQKLYCLKVNGQDILRNGLWK